MLSYKYFRISLKCQNAAQIFVKLFKVSKLDFNCEQVKMLSAKAQQLSQANKISVSYIFCLVK